jgi:hypothetical protein
MARTRLRGIEIGGIQIGIEVPASFEWTWPEGPIAEFRCLPRDPHVHVGVRVGQVPQGDLGGEHYRLGCWTLEVTRRGDDWLLGLARDGCREQLATFDSDFRTGEVVFFGGTARTPVYPLRSPIDEWIVLHRTLADGGLWLTATTEAIAGQARVRLGAPDEPPGGAPVSANVGSRSPRRPTVLMREHGARLRAFRTPWSDGAVFPLGSSAPVREFVVAEPALAPFRERLDPEEAAELLVAHTRVPLCDEALFDRVLRNASRLASTVDVFRVGATPPDRAPRERPARDGWSAFALPSSGG